MVLDSTENTLYFAYGSNLNQEDLDAWCKLKNCSRIDLETKKPIRAILNGYELAFDYCSSSRNCGVADVKVAPGKHVEGVLFEMTKGDMDSIKRKEGVAAHVYRPENITVRLPDGQEKDVKTYVVNVKEERCIPPSKRYLEIIISGAKNFGLSPEWIQTLNEIVPSDNGCQKRT